MTDTYERLDSIGVDASEEMLKRFDSLPLLTNVPSLRSMYSAFDTSRKLFAFHATAIYLMMRVFDDGYFFGLPAELSDIRNAMESIKCTARSHLSPNPANMSCRPDRHIQ